MKFLFSPEIKMFYPYAAHLVGQNGLVEVDWYERRAILGGESWASVLKRRGQPSSPVSQPAPSVERVQAPALIIPDVEVKREREKPEDVLKASVPGHKVLKVAIDRAEAGEPDEFGQEKRTFSGVGHWNVTVEMLDGVKDEELIQFAKHAVNIDYPEMDAADDAEKAQNYKWLRGDLEKKIRRIVKNRARRADIDKRKAEFNG